MSKTKVQQSVERTRMSRSAPCLFQRQRRFIPVAIFALACSTLWFVAIAGLVRGCVSKYLFGDLDGFATGLSGNVIDVAAGYEQLRAYHAPAYGSSGGADDRDHQSAAQVLYHNARYNFTFSLPASWRGYSVLAQQWEGQTYMPAAIRERASMISASLICVDMASSARDEVVVTEHGPIIVLRHPQWKASDPYQDIHILVFTRSQWEAHHQGRFGGIGAGGVEEEIGHNSKYVFAISSRFNAADSVKGWKEATDIVGRHMAANAPRLHPI